MPRTRAVESRPAGECPDLDHRVVGGDGLHVDDSGPRRRADGGASTAAASRPASRAVHDPAGGGDPPGGRSHANEEELSADAGERSQAAAGRECSIVAAPLCALVLVAAALGARRKVEVLLGHESLPEAA